MGKIKVKVVPKSSKPQILRCKDCIKIKVNSPPTNGKANKELMELLSKKLHVPKSKIKILYGFSAREKYIQIDGIETDQILKKLFYN